MSKRNRKNGGLIRPGQSRTALRRPESNNDSKLVDKGAPAPPKSVIRQVWKVWHVFWAFVGLIIAVNGLWFTMTPSIAIEPSVNIDPANIYATQTVVINLGRVPVYDVKSDCVIGTGGGQTVLNGIMNRPDIPPIARLDAGEAITRSCDVGSIDIQGNTRIQFEASFAWPIIGGRETKQVIFDVKKGTPGYFLAPDALP